MYILYIFIYQYNATRGTPMDLNGGLSGDRGLPNPTNGHRTFGLNSYLPSSVPQAARFCWGN